MNHSPARAARRVAAVTLLAALAGTGAASCGKSTPSVVPTQGSAVSTGGSTPAPTTPTAAPANASDWCALVIKIGTDTGVLVGKHYISPLNETLDQLKALVNESLAAGNQLETGLPDDVRAAVLVEAQYFQALKDHDFASDTPAPPGLPAAIKVVDQYQTSACGLTFDQ